MQNRPIALAIAGVAAIAAVVAIAFRSDQTSNVVAPVRGQLEVLAADPRLYPAYRSEAVAAESFDVDGRLVEAFVGQRMDGRGALPDAQRLAIRTLIVTLPNPYDSRLDWTYDAHLDAVRRAFAAGGFMPDAFELQSLGDSIVLRDANGRPERRVRASTLWPGVMLFRGESDVPKPSCAGNGRQKAQPCTMRVPTLWIAYVVLESPTTGIDKVALMTAMSRQRGLWKRAGERWYHDTNDDTVRVLGPTFSGSAISLQRAVSATCLPRRPGDTLVVRVVSGAATAISSIDLPESGQVPTATKCAPARIERSSTVRSDCDMVHALWDSVLRPMGTLPSQVAELTEDQTAYGEPGDEGGAPCGGSHPVFVRVPFPMNVSSLHSEFDRSPAMQVDGRELPGVADVPRANLSLEQGSSPSERPSIASRLTVPTLDVVVRDIERILLMHRVRFVLLRSTDIRDRLMLARALRRRMRDVTFLILEPQALLLRPDYRSALSGSLTVSSYALPNELELWQSLADVARRDTGSVVRLFGNDLAIGVYNATTSLIGGKARRIGLGDVSAPDAQPPIWLSLIGREAFIPLKRIPAAEVSAATSRLDARIALPALRLWPLAGLVLALAIVGWLSFRLYRVELPSDAVQSGHRVALSDRLVGCWFEVQLVLSACALLAPILALSDAIQGASAASAVLLPIVASVFVALWSVRFGTPAVVSDVRESGTPVDRKRRIAFYATLACIVFCSVVYTIAVLVFSRRLSMAAYTADRFVMLRRLHDVFGGGSPLVVLGAFGLAFMAWTYWQAGMLRSGNASPFERALRGMSTRSASSLNLLRSLGRDMQRLRRVQRDLLPDELAVLALVIIVGFLAPSMPDLLWPREFEGVTWLGTGFADRCLHVAIFVGSVLLLVTIAWNVVRLISSWHGIEQVLNLFLYTRMEGAFRQVPTDVVAAARPSLLGVGMYKQIGFGHEDDEDQLHRTHKLVLAARLELSQVVSASDGTPTPAVHEYHEAALRLEKAGFFSPLDRSDDVVRRVGRNGARGASRVRYDRGTRRLARAFSLEVGYFIARAVYDLRRLALLLVLTLLLGVIATTFYPVQPQSSVRLVLSLLMVWAIGSLLYVITKMSTSRVLYALTHAEPGDATWDSALFLNLLVFTVVPLFAFLASEIPAVRTLLVAWVEPVLRALTQ